MNECDIFCRIADGVEMDNTFVQLEDEYEELTDEDREIMLKYFFAPQEEWNKLRSSDTSDDKMEEALNKILKEMRDKDLEEYWDNVNNNNENENINTKRG